MPEGIYCDATGREYRVEFGYADHEGGPDIYRAYPTDGKAVNGYSHLVGDAEKLTAILKPKSGG